MAAYLYFEFDSIPADVVGIPSWGYVTSTGTASGSIGTLVDWTVADLTSATGFTFDTATSQDLGGGISRYRATKNVAEGYDLNDLSQDYVSALQNFTNLFVPVRLFDSSVTPPADLTICTECRQSRQQACADSYLITAGLTQGDTYYVTITDRNNNLYIQSIVADANGDLTIDALSSEFPNGFWLSESGTKSIIVYEDVNRTIVADLTVGANVYTCMILTLQYIYTTTT
jgi:hypothetical protein